MNTMAIAETPAKTLLSRCGSDTPHGVTKQRVLQASEALGMTETQLIHKALVQYIARALPQYDLDYESLTDEDHAAIAERVDQTITGELLSSII